MADEKPLLNSLQVLASRLGARLFRNNVGKAWVGNVIHAKGLVTIRNPRVLNAGLCTGSSDLIGWMPVTITPEMVGSQVAVFLAVEAKTDGVDVTKDQEAFLRKVQDDGGIALVAWEDADLDRVLKQKSPPPR